MTDKFNDKNPRHLALKQGIEVGNGLPDIAKIDHVLRSLKKAGFEVMDSCDLARGSRHLNNQIPWYDPLRGSWSVTGFRMTWVGRVCTQIFVTILETLRIAPKGSSKVSKLLNDTANDLVAAGEMAIFTPAFFYIARKPLRK